MESIKKKEGGITSCFLLAWGLTTLPTKYQGTELCMNNRQFKNYERMYTQRVKLLMHPTLTFSLHSVKSKMHSLYYSNNYWKGQTLLILIYKAYEKL
jgi:hypothetical protein